MIAMIEKLAPAKNKHKVSFEIQAIKQHDNDVSEGLTLATALGNASRVLAQPITRRPPRPSG